MIAGKYATGKGRYFTVSAAPKSVAELLPSWEVALRAEHKSPHTIAQYRDGVRLFLRSVRAHGRDPGARQAHGAGVYRRPVRRRGPSQHRPGPLPGVAPL